MKMPIRIIIALVGVLLVVGALGTIKGLQIKRMIAHGESFVPPAQTVTAAEAQPMTWERTYTTVGSLEAVQGVMVTAELSGKVAEIAFKSGAGVSSGDLLLQQDVSAENAQLRAARSKAFLARKNLGRSRALYQENVISISDLDERQAAYEQAAAEVDNLLAVIGKKTIRAPFAGRLGISRVDMGEVMDSGQPIVSLQSLDPIFANFQLPQQALPDLSPGLKVRAGIDAQGDLSIEGRITAINPEVDSTTRNIRMQAVLDNRSEELRPGMYVNVTVVLPDARPVLAIPATAVVYAPYSDSVFLIETQDSDSAEKQQVLRQQFVQLGEKRGDFVAVQNGLEAGQRVVSTGVFKLRNGMAVVVDNELSPEFQLSPHPGNS
jgi:membrane fusion protein (multidrug efflux system)